MGIAPNDGRGLINRRFPPRVWDLSSCCGVVAGRGKRSILEIHRLMQAPRGDFAVVDVRGGGGRLTVERQKAGRFLIKVGEREL